MSMSAQARSVWEQAQIAEQGHWVQLWLSVDSEARRALIENETAKGDFIFAQMTNHFKVQPKPDWSKLSVVDIGCGPLSLIARKDLGKTRFGVDPLPYPSWVYEEYARHDFTVFKQPFEELTASHKFDVLVFYNALQHFADLALVAGKCQEILSQSGVVYVCEYLQVPTNEAHIQYLEASILDTLFADAGLKVISAVLPVRLPGYVERPNGAPIDLYVAKLQRP